MRGENHPAELCLDARTIARRLPGDMRALRSRMMLESVCETIGVEEVRCPACGGTGWLDRRRLEDCPLCCGFQEVPRSLADWFRNQMASRPAAQADAVAPAALPGGPREPDEPAPWVERIGRIAERPCRVYLTSMD